MSLSGRLRLSLTTTVFIAGLAGCSPSDSSQQDEEKEPHYVDGSAKVKSLDYEGAAEAFEEALEVNPHSASAHFELGWLYDEKVPDPAAAIYHYQQYLKYDPKAENAQIISQRVSSCKQRLAENALELPSTPAAQQQLQKMIEKCGQLQQQVDQLQGIVRQWNAYYASQQAAQAAQSRQTPSSYSQPVQNVANTPGTSTTPDDISNGTGGTSSGSGTTANSNTIPEFANNSGGSPRTSTHSTTGSSSSANPAHTGKRSHVVQAGETMAGIARKSGVTLNALLEANPSINPKKLRAGQTVTVP